MSIQSLLSRNEYKFDDLCEIMNILRSENGCPWDREQDHQSIRNNFIEEAYEFIEGVDKLDYDIMCEELGDVLLQIVFHSEMASEKDKFDINKVTDGICKKLILRHPHIFSDVSVKDSTEVLKNWDLIKKDEKGQKTVSDSLNAVSSALPALVRASKIQHKAAKVGFDFNNALEAMNKVKEETEEVEAEIEKNSHERIEEEFGDLLFAVVNAARLCGVNSEEALYKANAKFCRRFELVEKEMNSKNLELSAKNIHEMDIIWNNIKKK